MNFIEWLLKGGRSVPWSADSRAKRDWEMTQFRGCGVCSSADGSPSKVAIRYGRGNAMLCSGRVMTRETIKRLRQKAAEVCYD